MGRKDSSLKKVGKLNLREEAAKATLRAVRQQGHVYVELRKVSDSSIFFCALCLTQCFSEAVLYDHLRGNLHSRRYNCAKITLLLPNPWPFNDGFLFYDNSREKDLNIMPVSESQRDVVIAVTGVSGSPANVDELRSKCRGTPDQDLVELTSDHNINGRNAEKPVTVHKKIKKCMGVKEHISLCYVLPNEKIFNMELEIIGYGHISGKIHEDSERNCKFSRIWCAWLGDGNSDGCDELLASPISDFAIVSFSYTHLLGKVYDVQDENWSHSPGSSLEEKESGRQNKKIKKSFPDDPCASACEHSHNADPENVAHSFDHSQSGPSQPMQEAQKQNCLISNRPCFICDERMIFGKDVATLLNLKTGRFACSSRNFSAAFHLFHVSCLINWVLLCEFEMWTQRSMNPRRTRGRKGKEPINKRVMTSIVCSACMGSGIHTEKGAREGSRFPLPQILDFKKRTMEGHKAWMESPENLQNCSTGLCFSSVFTDKLQAKSSPAKSLLFYRVGE
ncbi:uncharacterized protein LOC110025678 [Phalaenopsis equestris]|uniref:uncharacterized protein LOC110025678 n=1 Tax=Phalaenopsis equestris TaxID=78828 RepID=UPI0009E2D39C|nr:uncharacterized protein LOC110025678 [Phalaenopsis equestris]XP_020581946.1 uncharacterized protein LOC110025678 [Phalaenopsis equestris]XP_020581947.1 uncharacterized protein LOC110025678 [Phalaenopsis equestris]